MIDHTDLPEKMIVGSEEWCALPQLGIPAIKVRVDSGAKTSSLHAFNIRPFSRGGISFVSFEVHPVQGNRRTIVRCEAEVTDKRVVKSSSGIGEKRFVVKTMLAHRDQQWEVELTLTNRDSMGFRMLLGREAMNGRILVDPSSSFAGGKVSNNQIEQLYHEHTRESSGLRIGLLASNPDLASNQRILEAGEERGHRIRFYDIRQCYMKLDAEHPEIHYRGGKLLNNLDAVIPRIRPDLTFYGCALVRQFESLGIYSLNSAQAISHSRDKLYSLQHLLQHGLPIPTTGFADSPLDTDDLIDMVNGAPLIVKLLEGPQHRGVVLAESRNAGESLINAFRSLQANLLVQEFIKEAEGRSLRLLVADNKVVCAVERQAAPGHFRSNRQNGSSLSPARLSAEERKLALRAAKVMGLKVAGVDIIRSRKGPLLLEVNSSPSLGDLEDVSGKDLAGTLISAVEKQLGWKRRLANPVDTQTAPAQV
ncbi:MAG: 30S ribosomal protein S6--L-glutamate ligase [Pseudohongiella sp.]|nr:30S ribosomal protein S6--L-glutamate ligase [Pseudohongiella sp.]MDP2126572.1 30S ribosomal protein S6--L-glutamate ligase [Pseudohongiella sp.]